ncbi:flagellar protein, FliL [uncultured Methanobrevibacter sp.]|uniref:flagellar protein, FliL n=1 Tax=uncultured Methanobrevibacter sp. TaxID=253161 RepID=UPI0025D7D7FF|nr:flagellar protein, FliL [uncultured Methanobrevibacter sp.]
MKGFIVVVLGIIAALLIVGGAVAYSFMNELGVNMEDIDSNTIDKIKDKVSNVASSESSDSPSASSSEGSNIVDEVVKFNAQNGEGYYREVTYSDGGFRQYDTESGDLIGSSYDSDKDKLPSLE